MSTSPNEPLTKADFEAGLQQLRDYIDAVKVELIRLYGSQQIVEMFRRFDELKASTDWNPHNYTPEDIHRLLDEAQAEIRAEGAKS